MGKDKHVSGNLEPSILPRQKSSSASIIKNPLSTCSSKDCITPTPDGKRASLSANPNEIALPQLPRRQTVSHLDLSSRPTSADQCHYRSYPRVAGFSEKAVELPFRCTEEQFLETILHRFPQGVCWYINNGRLFFVNPFSDISSSKRRSSPAISTISLSLLKQRNAALIMRGISGSGKSQIAELVSLDIAHRLCRRENAFAKLQAAFIALRPFITVNNKHNNQSSSAVAHMEFCIRRGRLVCVKLNHFMVDSPSRGCRANIFAMLANDLDEHDKEKYRISGFRLKDNHQGFGNVVDLSAALTQLEIFPEDVFKVVSACILLNNLSFKEINDSVDIENLSG
ncbi:unnamed protein product [Strongylus vulgaris]|uniref:Myosin motor domain-containing protein n=1 Tax=Strongylus vulgaris TaxID=40348 RepID=A0A3P7J350_STRVU|nr:unnamed protein product [Strongylus vulgaris]